MTEKKTKLDGVCRLGLSKEIRQIYNLEAGSEIAIKPMLEGILLIPIKHSCAICGVTIPQNRNLCPECQNKFNEK